MTKKDFIQLADTIRNANSGAKLMGHKPVFGEGQIQVLSDFCQAQNPLFKRDRWLSYIAGTCGKNGGTVK